MKPVCVITLMQELEAPDMRPDNKHTHTHTHTPSATGNKHTPMTTFTLLTVQQMLYFTESC